MYVERGDLHSVKRLVEAGRDPNHGEELYLRCASRCGRLKVVKYLVSIGADCRIMDDTPVSLAVEHDQLEVVKFLVDKGADITNSNFYLLSYASFHSRRTFNYIKELISTEMRKYSLLLLLNKKVVNKDLMPLIRFVYVEYYKHYQEFVKISGV